MDQNPLPETAPQNVPVSAGTENPATRRDYELGVVAGILIGLLALPILATAKPELFGKYWLFILAFFTVASPAGLFIASKLAGRLPIIWQVAKFVLIGGLNTLVDIGVLAATMAVFRNAFGVAPESVLLDVGIIVTVYSVYKAFSFFIANVNSFVWNKYWTFSGSTEKKNSAQFLQFFVVSLIGFFINNFFASFVFVSVQPVGAMTIEQWGLIGAAIGSVAGLVWNFLGYKFIVFKK